jgi:SET domain-containing protein
MYKIQVSQEMGRGIYAEQAIQENTIIFDAELLVLSPEDTIKVNETDLKYYTFKFSENQDCLVLGDGEIFNHDDHANVTYSLVLVDGRYKMRFTSTQIIPQGSQLFIDYNLDVKSEIDSYKQTKSLIA